MHLFCFVLDDTLEIHSEEDLPEDSPFLEAVEQMKEKKYDNIVDLCTQQIEKGLWSTPLLFNEFRLFFQCDSTVVLSIAKSDCFITLKQCTPPFIAKNENF